MIREPFIAHSELTNEIYIVSGREKYRVTEQAIKAVDAIKALKQEPKIEHCKDCKYFEYDSMIFGRTDVDVYNDEEIARFKTLADEIQKEIDAEVEE